MRSDRISACDHYPEELKTTFAQNRREQWFHKKWNGKYPEKEKKRRQNSLFWNNQIVKDYLSLRGEHLNAGIVKKQVIELIILSPDRYDAIYFHL